MGQVYTAKLVMQFVDELSNPALKATGALGKVQQAERLLADQSKRLADSTKLLSSFQKVDKALSETTAKYAQQQAALKALGQQILTTEGSTKKLEAQFKRANDQVENTRKVMERQKTAAAEVAGSFEHLSGTALNSIASAESKVRSGIESTTQALRQQADQYRRTVEAEEAAAHRRANRRQALSATAGVIGTALDYRAAQVAEKTLETYREFDNARRYGKAVMGLTDQQQVPLVQQAIHGGATTKFNDIQWLETQRELAARGYDLKQVMAFAPVVAKLGQAFDVTMPEAVKGLEGAMLGFKKDVSTPEKAMAAAQRTADLEVKASKISGMNFEDVVQLYKYAAAPAQMAHLSEESMLAFGAIAKKSNMGGDESGTAFRALAKNLLTPTSDARTAMAAAGIDFSKYQTAPKAIKEDEFAGQVAQRYGVTLNEKSRAELHKIFTDPALLGDADKFMPAVVDALKSTMGKQDAKSLKSVAHLAGHFRDASTGGVDTNGLMASIMSAMAKNPALANSIFGSKQGGRIYAALGDPAFFGKILDELHNQSQGYAQKVSDERMGGFDGAVSRLEGSVKNLETAVGRALDNDGKGGLLTGVTNEVGHLTQALAEANPRVLQVGTAAALAAAGFGAIKTFGWLKDGFGLGTASTSLIEASALEKRAATALLGAAERLDLVAGKEGLAGSSAAAGSLEREKIAGAPGEKPTSEKPSRSGLAGGLSTAAQLLTLFPLAQAASDAGIGGGNPKEEGWRGVLEGLDPNFPALYDRLRASLTRATVDSVAKSIGAGDAETGAAGSAAIAKAVAGAVNPISTAHAAVLPPAYNLSIGLEKGPRIGVQKGPTCRLVLRDAAEGGGAELVR